MSDLGCKVNPSFFKSKFIFIAYIQEFAHEEDFRFFIDFVEFFQPMKRKMVQISAYFFSFCCVCEARQLFPDAVILVFMLLKFATKNGVPPLCLNETLQCFS